MPAVRSLIGGSYGAIDFYLRSVAKMLTPAVNMDYRVNLEVFEGPLDLLLHLVRKHELDILDIPISFVTTKYNEYLDVMTELNIDVAGEYLVMAATLAQIKSRELLPREQNLIEDEELEEELGDPRGELIRRLLAYQKYKDAAVSLGNRPVVGRNVWSRGTSQEDALSDVVNQQAQAALAEVPVDKLLMALKRVFERARISLVHQVSVEKLSVSERINQLVDKLGNQDRITFFSCFKNILDKEAVSAQEVKQEAIVTFLAVLEMCRLQLVRVTQQENSDELWIIRKSSSIEEEASYKVAKASSYEYDS